MKRYFITDQAGLDWRKTQWNIGTAYHEKNDNYWFATFDDPLVALFLDPACSQTENPKIWQVDPIGDQKSLPPQVFCSQMKIIVAVDDALPTNEQYVTFGIVCALNVITDKDFSDWAIGWLKNIDRSKETAEKLAWSIEPGECTGAAFCCLQSVITEKPALHAASAALRAFYDSSDPLELKQIARIVATMTTLEIGMLLGGNDGRGNKESETTADSTSLHDNDGSSGTQQDNDDKNRTEDVRLGEVLPGNEEESPRNNESSGPLP